MKVKVKLHGTLRQNFQDYQPSHGIEIEIPDGATVKDLLDHLGILETRGAAVITSGRVLKADHKLQAEVSVDIFQSIQGG